MVKFIVWCPAYKLYVENVIPESESMLFTAKRSKAYPFFKVDADLVLGYVKDSTGMAFEMLQV
jgi:hypothetical protein